MRNNVKRKNLPADLFPTERMLAFSDAIMAFAATLLVLGIHIPQAADLAGGKRLIQVALEQWPAYLSFAISFVMMTIIWANHHAMFCHIRKADHVLLLINSLLMMDVVLIPLAAGSLGEYMLMNPQDARMAAFIYGAVLTIGGIPFNMIWWYALRTPGLVVGEKSRKTLAGIGRRFIRGPITYLIATLLALWHVWASLALYVGLIIYFLVPATGIWNSKKTG
ncbi:MAG TPA: TMEM175 family protein [bacterium]|nr:TMEM175 family protein [bacterium]